MSEELCAHASFDVPQARSSYGRCQRRVSRPKLGTFVVKRVTRSCSIDLWSSLTRWGALTWVLCGLPAPAFAAENHVKEYPPCTERADEVNLQAARGAFEAGKAAFNESDYPRSILYWEDAFRRDCSATLLLKNLTRAYEANHQYAEAANALRTYLERAPEAEDRQELEAHLRVLENKVEPANPPPGPKPVKQQPTQTEPKPAPPPASFIADNDTDGEPAFDDGSSVNGPKLAAGIVAGAGAVLALTSGVFWYQAHTDERAASDACPQRFNCSPDITQRGNDAIDRKQRWAWIAGGGVALMAGGVAWYLLLPSESSTAGLQPSLGPTHAGLNWSGSF